MMSIEDKKEDKKSTGLRDKEATKCRILDAAEEEFARGGLMGARTEAIASKTGTTKSMIFYHFKDKEGLYLAVLERAVARRLRVLQKIDLHGSDPEAVLRVLVETLLDDVSAHLNLTAIFMYEAIQNKGKYYSEISLATVYVPLIDLLKRGIESGQFRVMDPHHAAVNIIGMSVFYYCSLENIKHLWPPGTDMLSKEMKEQHRQEAVEQIVAGIRA
ncbi:MAG: TetR/AcrR family transcriptional regulator [Candidatus Obscuribacterales bacterium]|nr:TetR/AcrR family transcriptional regulator [Candidatus Obscuribacterales bacterium]